MTATATTRPSALFTTFRWVAVVEACSWLALIVATLVKYTTDPQMEGGVEVLGPVHGGLFTLYVVLALVVAWKLRWSFRTLVVVLVDSVLPAGGFLVARRDDLRRGRIRV
ncbi:DUF3817 domain-containing protein [Jatrophihabitans sp. YIM 134969]